MRAWGSPFTIPADQASIEITIAPVQDNLEEGIEMVIITLSNSSSYVRLVTPARPRSTYRTFRTSFLKMTFEIDLEKMGCQLTRAKLTEQNSLIELGDGTVFDLDSGLQWSMCWIGQDPDPYEGTCHGTPNSCGITD